MMWYLIGAVVLAVLLFVSFRYTYRFGYYKGAQHVLSEWKSVIDMEEDNNGRN